MIQVRVSCLLAFKNSILATLTLNSCKLKLRIRSFYSSQIPGRLFPIEVRYQPPKVEVSKLYVRPATEPSRDDCNVNVTKQ